MLCLGYLRDIAIANDEQALALDGVRGFCVQTLDRETRILV